LISSCRFSFVSVTNWSKLVTQSTLTEEDYVKSWLLFCLIAAVGMFAGAFLAGFGAGVVLEFLAGLTGHASDAATWSRKGGEFVGCPAAVVATYFCYRFSVKRLIARLDRSTSV
jgi:hypothetical protein